MALNLAFDFAVIAFGFAIFYYVADSQWAKMIGKWFFLICIFISTFSAWVQSGQQNWIMFLFFGQMAVMILFLYMDIFIPFLLILKKWIWKK